VEGGGGARLPRTFWNASIAKFFVVFQKEKEVQRRKESL